MPADPPASDAPPALLSLEDLLPAELSRRLEQVSPGIAWALDSLVVSFGAEVQQLDNAAREAFARLTLSYGESLTQFLRLAHEAADPDQSLERARKMALLRRLDLFAGLNDFDLGQIATAFQPLHMEEGHDLARQGQEGHAVYFLERGRVGIIVDGNQVAVRGEGTLFGETSVITGEPTNATLRAVTPCEVLRISREDFIQHVMGLPELVPKIARIGFTRLEEATHRLSEVLSHMPDALLKIDREGIITGDISSKCFAYLGQEVLTGRRLADVLFKDHPSLRERWVAAFPELWAHPERYRDDAFDIPRSVAFTLTPGDERHYELNLSPCHRRGEQEGFDVAIADVTERKRVEAERARMHRALQRQKRKFMLFRLGGQLFGLEIEKVREIVEPPPITRLPNAPDWLRGFCNLRGHIVPVLDTATLLRLPPAEAEGRGCIFIVHLERDRGRLEVGFLTDGADDILEVFDADITLADDLALHSAGLDFLYGIARAEEGERLLLDPERLVTADQQRELDTLRPQE